MRVLSIDDDPDFRAAIATFLDLEGCHVTTASSVATGLDALRKGTFEVVLTDHELGDGTGVDLLRVARSEKMLGGAKAVIITARDPADIAANGDRILRKPLDIDALRSAIFEPAPPLRAPLLELVLYISASSASAPRAMRGLYNQLALIDARHVKVTIRDIHTCSPSAIHEDRIVFTPTLVKSAPLPRAWIVGDLEKSALLRDLLREYANVAEVAKE